LIWVLSVFRRNYFRGTYYKSIASSDSWVGTISGDSCPGSRTRRRDVWSSVTPAYHSAALNYPRPIEAGWSAIFSLGCRSLGPPVDYSACAAKSYAWSTRSVNISLKTTFIFYDAKKISFALNQKHSPDPCSPPSLSLLTLNLISFRLFL